jgi:hypothetical protein
VKPANITTSMAGPIAALSEDLRQRTLERAGMLWDSGLSWEEADRRAYELTTGRKAPAAQVPA